MEDGLEITSIEEEEITVVDNDDAVDAAFSRYRESITDSSSGETSFTSVSSLGKHDRSSIDTTSESDSVRRTRFRLDPCSPSSFTTHSEESRVGPPSTDPYEPIIIANSTHHQPYFDKLSFGVRWETHRIISKGFLEFKHIEIPKLVNLKGNNAEAAPRVVELIPDQENRKAEARGFAREMALKSPWPELDVEESVFQTPQNFRKSLGCEGEWYGGKIQFCARLVESLENVGEGETRKVYRIELDKPELGASTRFTRRFGSKRFLRIRVSKKIIYSRDNGLYEYFTRPFILDGRVYRLYTTKEQTAFMVETNENYSNGQIFVSTDKEDVRLSIYAFINWHNPIECNLYQNAAKWASRMALGLSNSVPGVLLRAENIHKLKDIISPSFTGSGKPPSEAIMTDGCGYANAAFMKAAKDRYGWDTFPTAIQLRIGGYKGLVVLHPNGRDDKSEEPQVWLRPSQQKIIYPKSATDTAYYVAEILRYSKPKHSSRLSAEVIINLAENDVPLAVFANLLKDDLERIYNCLADWDSEKAMIKLHGNVGRLGSVMAARLARELRGESRVRGFSSREEEDEEEELDDVLAYDIAINDTSTAWWEDEISGCPSSLEEFVLVLLKSGFRPDSCPVLALKLNEVLKKCLKSQIDRYRIPVAKSCEAFIIPDPFGVLEPGEIYFKSSKSIMNAEDCEALVLEGDILVTRHPCKLPTDVQKVRAVDKAELRQYVDVVVFSVKGDRSLASLLGGGDYDGDKVIAIWESKIVSKFKNADIKYAKVPDLTEKFVKNNETMADIMDRTRTMNDIDKLKEIQKYLLGPLCSASVVGTYSNLHDNAVYQYGYGHPKSLYLANMFCKCLDGVKTGDTVLSEVLKSDKREFEHRPPLWKETEEARVDFEKKGDNQTNLRRNTELASGWFVMDYIRHCGYKRRDKYIQSFGKLKEKCESLSPDEDLTKPWRDAETRQKVLTEKDPLLGARMKFEMDLMLHHVEDIYKEYREAISDPGKYMDSVQGEDSRFGKRDGRREKKGTLFSKLPIEVQQNIKRGISFKFFSGPPDILLFSPEELKNLRASYAYIYDLECANGRKVTQFSWDVATGVLCEIKAKKFGNAKVVTSEFYDAFTVHQHYMKN